MTETALFHTVLIANRGEIACRIIATLRRMGIRSVAVFSDADAGSRHVHLADEAVRLGPAAAHSSYLDADRVIEAALRTGSQAVHPGYGFLAENADFARACHDAGLVFIGPGPDAIATMGDKIAAKLAVSARRVPTVPGIARAGLTDEELAANAATVGYPLLIKPSAGGGGKGMHVVADPAHLRESIAAARREAAASFGDDTLFLERYLQRPRHIEVQILADAHGNVIHLGERECSLQRRHQKVIEEAPSPLLDHGTRERIGRAACETARSVDYRGAGTVEFIVEAYRPEEFFFMEMNTRLQVEHPVTEEITGIDLVEQQIRIAAGEALRITQEDVQLHGHSFEARVYAEDPQAGFLPTGGRVERVRHPDGEGIRVDTALEDGLEVSVDYDPMLAKIVTWGSTRDEARRRLVAALRCTAVLGFTTNVEFLQLLLELPEVVAGDLDTDLIARSFDDLPFAVADDSDAARAALLLDARTPPPASPWLRGDGWRLGEPAGRTYVLSGPARVDTVTLRGSRERALIVDADGTTPTAVTRGEGSEVTIGLGDRLRTLDALVRPDEVELIHDGIRFVFARQRVDHGALAGEDVEPQLASPMPGTVVMTSVVDGARIEAGDPVVVVEAMKMEHVIRSAMAGTVRLRVAVGDTVTRGQVVAEVAAPEEEEETA